MLSGFGWESMRGGPTGSPRSTKLPTSPCVRTSSMTGKPSLRPTSRPISSVGPLANNAFAPVSET